MSQSINTNIPSLNAQRNLNESQNSLSTALERLSTGLRINSAKDDAAGLAISSRFTTQINGLNQAVRNANDGISLAQTAEGSLNATSESLQRIRQLALQSGNSTNSSSDRAALNAEASALLAEVQRVAQTTQFNGTNLLDGSFTNGQFQVGANAGQTIGFGIGGAGTDLLGAYQSTGTAVSANAFDGDSFTINGTEVGVSTAGTGNGVTAESAAAKATTINAKASETGVTATANTTLQGSTPLVGVGLNNGELVINSVSIGSIASDTNAVVQGRNARDAINAVSNQTGVIATTDANTGALTLNATDGRDITLTTSGTDAGTRQIATQNIQNAIGLDVSDGVSATVNEKVTLTFDADVEGSGTGIKAGATSGDGDTIAIGGQTYQFVTDATYVSSGNVAVVVGAGGTAALSITALEGAIDTERAAGRSTVETGTKTATSLVLDSTVLGINTVAAAGAIAEATSTNAGAITSAVTTAGVLPADDADGVTTRGTITLSSAANFTLGGTDLAHAGMTGASSTLAKLNTVDISTLQGANDAISILDGALSQVNSIRGDLGAIQNRFEATISNLSITSENLSAARGRILDADFAQESATLSRSSILQQAGISVLAQANSLPQQVLSLLQ